MECLDDLQTFFYFNLVHSSYKLIVIMADIIVSCLRDTASALSKSSCTTYTVCVWFPIYTQVKNMMFHIFKVSTKTFNLQTIHSYCGWWLMGVFWGPYHPCCRGLNFFDFLQKGAEKFVELVICYTLNCACFSSKHTDLSSIQDNFGRNMKWSTDNWHGFRKSRVYSFAT